MRLGKTVVTFKPERAFNEPRSEPEPDVFTETTRRTPSRPTRRYGELRDDTDPRWVRADTLPASMLFDENDEEPDTLVVDTPLDAPLERCIPTPRETVLQPVPLFEDSGLFRL